MPSKAGFIAAAAAVLALASNLGAAKIVERIIARVNNQIITQRQFDRDRQQLRARLAGDYSGVELEVQVREQSKNLLRDMIDQDLMVQKAKDLDINVETEVVKQLDEMRKKYNLASLEDARKYFNEHKQEFASPEGVRLAEILISPDKHNPPEVEQRTKEALAEI